MKKYLVMRTLSGISGDMLMTGLAKLSGLDDKALNELIASIGLPELEGSLTIKETSVDKISGWKATVRLEAGHSHRTFQDIRQVIEASQLTNRAKRLAKDAFSILAGAEAEVHGLDPKKVVFHEIGALDSILDICLSSILFDRLDVAKFISSPLPVCDGVIQCAHGVLSSPAPAVLRLLEGVPVYGIDSEGETVTPTGLALLKAFGAEFGPWPALTVQKTVTVYGSRILPKVPNGAVFALGEPIASDGSLDE